MQARQKGLVSRKQGGPLDRRGGKACAPWPAWHWARFVGTRLLAGFSVSNRTASQTSSQSNLFKGQRSSGLQRGRASTADGRASTAPTASRRASTASRSVRSSTAFRTLLSFHCLELSALQRSSGSGSLLSALQDFAGWPPRHRFPLAGWRLRRFHGAGCTGGFTGRLGALLRRFHGPPRRSLSGNRPS